MAGSFPCKLTTVYLPSTHRLLTFSPKSSLMAHCFRGNTQVQHFWEIPMISKLICLMFSASGIEHMVQSSRIKKKMCKLQLLKVHAHGMNDWSSCNLKTALGGQSTFGVQRV